MRNFVRKFSIAACAAAAWMVVGAAAVTVAPVEAQAQEIKSLSDLLKAVQQGRVRDRQTNQQREAEFRQAKNRQQSLLNKAKDDLAREEARSDALEAEFAERERILNDLAQQLQERLGAFGEMFGVIRQVAGDTKGQIENSLISAQLPDRAGPLGSLATSQALPSIDQLEGLWVTLTQEMIEQGKVATFEANVVSRRGETEARQVTRLGPFTAVSEGRFLTYEVDESGVGKLKELGRQPASRFLSAAGRVENAKSGPEAGFVRAAVDPSSGTILSLLVQAPSLIERVNQGGIVGYVIIGVASFGILLGLWRIFVLWTTSAAVSSQMRAKQARKGNPLGRVMMAYEENTSADVETLELKLDDAILRELPRLEFGLNTLKLLAAVAPLMGLLGTVTGMIITFQAITLFGTGDPKLMAGGISQALVTTVLGLVAAIPLLFLHSFANGSARSVQQVLEEQAAGLVARHAEGQ